MKKIVSGLIAALMVAAALTAFTGVGAANARATYPKSVNTFPHIHAPNHVKAHHRAKICVTVKANSNRNPRGHVTLRAVKRNGADKYVSTHAYRGHTTCFRTTPLKRGKYSVKASYDPKVGSRWKHSHQRIALRVTHR